MADPEALVRHLRSFQEELVAVAASVTAEARDTMRAHALMARDLAAADARVQRAVDAVEEWQACVIETEERLAASDEAVLTVKGEAERAITRSRRVAEVVGHMWQRCRERLEAATQELSRIEMELQVAKGKRRARLLRLREEVQQRIDCCRAAVDACRRAGGLVGDAGEVAAGAERDALAACDDQARASSQTAEARSRLDRASSAADQGRQAMVAAGDHGEAARKQAVLQQEAAARASRLSAEGVGQLDAAAEHLKAIDGAL